jgi:hypothetical protein
MGSDRRRQDRPSTAKNTHQLSKAENHGVGFFTPQSTQIA